jgi:hypothetical protein
MNLRTRKMLFLLFSVCFAVAAPAVVLYTAGYRYSFGTGRIVQTGLLSLASVPKGAFIALDGDRARAVTPALLKNVLPGDHAVRVEKDGYSAWEKTLTVWSRQTTFADDIMLFLNAEPALLRATTASAAGFDPVTGRATYAETTGQWTEIWTYDPFTGGNTLVGRLPIGEEARIAFDWPNGDSVLAVRASTEGVTKIHYVDAATGQAVEAPSPNEVRLSALEDRVAVSRRSGDANDILAYIPSGSYELRRAPDGIVMLEDTERKRVVLVRAEGGDQPILLNAAASFWEWEPGGARLLYSDGFDLHVYDAVAHADSTITRLSSAVTGVTWYPEHGTVLYAQDDAVHAAELDHRGRRNVVTLMTGSGLGPMRVLRATLYAFGTVNETSGLHARPLER